MYLSRLLPYFVSARGNNYACKRFPLASLPTSTAIFNLLWVHTSYSSEWHFSSVRWKYIVHASKWSVFMCVYLARFLIPRSRHSTRRMLVLMRSLYRCSVTSLFLFCLLLLLLLFFSSHSHPILLFAVQQTNESARELVVYVLFRWREKETHIFHSVERHNSTSV